MNDTPIQDAYRTLLDAAAEIPATIAAPPEGEWNADQILAHVCIVTAATIAAASCVASGANTTYDNRTAQDTWTIDRVVTLAGGSSGLHERIRLQGESLALLGASLSDGELGAQVPTLLLSGGTVLVDQPLSLRDILTGLAEVELPGHTQQLLALPRHGAGARTAGQP